MEALFLQDQAISAYKESRSSNCNILISCSAPCSSKRKLVGRTTTIYGNEHKRLGPFGNCSKSDLLLGIHGSSYRSLSCQKPPLPQKPPLLPLPLNTSNLPMIPRNFSPKDQHRTPQPTQNPIRRKLENRDQPREKHVKKMGPLNYKLKPDLIITSTNRLGPDPSDLPKEVPGIFRSVSSITEEIRPISSNEKWFGSVSTISSPPPSSLPLPRFSLKSKNVSCNAQAGGIDTGATNNLRRLLKLH